MGRVRMRAAVTVAIFSLAAQAAVAAPTSLAFASSSPAFDPAPVAAPRSAAERQSMGRALMAAELYVALAAAPEAAQSGPVSVAARGVMLADGSTAMAVFTSKEKLHRVFGDEAAVIALDGRAALAIYGLSALVLDYGTSDELVWSPEDTRALLEAGG